MSEPSASELWRRCVAPDWGPAEPIEGFEVLVAAEEPTAMGGLLYRTVRCVWHDDEWVDQEDRVIARAEPHGLDEPPEELKDAWDAFCLRVDDLNRERARERRLTELVIAPQQRGRLSDLAATAMGGTPSP